MLAQNSDTCKAIALQTGPLPKPHQQGPRSTVWRSDAQTRIRGGQNCWLETMACGRFLPVLAQWPGVRLKGDTQNFITRLIYLIFFRAVEWRHWHRHHHHSLWKRNTGKKPGLSYEFRRAPSGQIHTSTHQWCSHSQFQRPTTTIHGPVTIHHIDWGNQLAVNE